ncbi:hypothetical protein XELAEV_18006566mg [Xenopus laevis]|uniref:Hexosyltransferase n=1 Tax=Xenopus laevis TaxID=8355 RepID=A0A974E025_XENLA|nr:hypothetical protein XELAEV_18006566mg [Xenopus laevis]
MKKHFCKCLLGTVAVVILLRYTLYLNSFYESNIGFDKKEELFFADASLSSQSIIELPHAECKENSSVHNFTNFDKEPQTMKDFLTYQHCRDFPQLLDSPMKCGGAAKSKEVFLLLAIKSSPANYERREAVRNIWGVEKTYNGVHVKRIFLIGIPTQKKQAKRMMPLVTAESQLYNDVLQWDFYDTFYNLTLKQVLFLTWLEARCPGAQYIFNGDDDVFVNTINVISYLKSLGKDGNKHHLFVGALNEGMPPVRESYSKYYVPETLFNRTEFDPYCGGGGILISGFTTHCIFRESQHIPFIPIDDAYLGMCLKRAGLKPTNHEGIRTLGINLSPVDSFDPCYYRDMLIVHRFVPYEMLVMWKALQITEMKCSWKSRASVKKDKLIKQETFE